VGGLGAGVRDRHATRRSTRVDGHVSAQENIVNFSPKQMLRPGVSYTLEIPAGGVRDYSGNVIAEGFTSTFKTAGG
jgi:hypothetical protein